MADGVTHYRWYKLIFIPIAIPTGVGLFLVLHLMYSKWDINPYIFFLFYLLNYFMARFIDPDLDQIGLTNAEGRMISKKGGFVLSFVGALNASYWFMYAWGIGWVGGHRSFFSHGWIIGTLIRMVYFNIPVGILLDWIIKRFTISVTWNGLWVWVAPYFVGQFCAWFLTDGTHLFLDTEFFKKINKRG
jgi:hypothetical protein